MKYIILESRPQLGWGGRTVIRQKFGQTDVKTVIGGLINIVSYSDSRLHAAGDLLHFIFRDRYVEWAAARGGVCVCEGGQCMFFKFCMYSKWFNFKAYTLQRYSDKKSHFFYSTG